MSTLDKFTEVWAVDFEFTAPPGCHPSPICMVAKEIRSGRVMRLDADSLVRHDKAPFNTGSDALFIAYYAPAEMSCFLALGWPLPVNVIDPFAEFRNLTNGIVPPGSNGLLAAARWFGLPMGDTVEKEEMRALAMRGGPYSSSEMEALLEYCQSDVEVLAALWDVMSPALTRHALLRGRYMKAVAWMERVGIPLDAATLNKLKDCWDEMKVHFAKAVDPREEIWRDGRHFVSARFDAWLKKNDIGWPRLPSGVLDLTKDTFSDMAKIHPIIVPIAQTRNTLSNLKLTDLVVGNDGRNRAMLSPFGGRSGRNQPSTSRFIFGNPSWVRGLIKPGDGNALAYIDWSQQEFGIGAVLSRDRAMKEAYTSSDPYMAFARMAGAVPSDATKESHPNERSTFKTVVLGVGYGMSAVGLAAKLGINVAEAEELLQMHRRCYPDFWRWSQGASDYGQLNGRIHTKFGWTLHLKGDTKDRTVRNFPSQANGAEMMRLAACYATEAGIRVCAPVHDAFLIEAPLEDISAEVDRMRRCMARASADLLDGFTLETDADLILSPERFGGGKPNPLWETATNFLN